MMVIQNCTFLPDSIASVSDGITVTKNVRINVIVQQTSLHCENLITTDVSGVFPASCDENKKKH